MTKRLLLPHIVEKRIKIDSDVFDVFFPYLSAADMHSIASVCYTWYARLKRNITQWALSIQFHPDPWISRHPVLGVDALLVQLNELYRRNFIDTDTYCQAKSRFYPDELLHEKHLFYFIPRENRKPVTISPRWEPPFFLIGFKFPVYQSIILQNKFRFSDFSGRAWLIALENFKDLVELSSTEAAVAIWLEHHPEKETAYTSTLYGKRIPIRFWNAMEALGELNFSFGFMVEPILPAPVEYVQYLIDILKLYYDHFDRKWAADSTEAWEYQRPFVTLFEPSYVRDYSLVLKSMRPTPWFAYNLFYWHVKYVQPNKSSREELLDIFESVFGPQDRANFRQYILKFVGDNFHSLQQRTNYDSDYHMGDFTYVIDKIWPIKADDS